MKHRAFLFFLLTLTASAEQKWIEVKTPHFRVISDASEGRTKKAAIAFEQMRAVIGIALSNARMDHGEDFVVIGAQDENTMKELLPAFWEGRGRAKPGGVFRTGMDRDYAVVRLDYPNDYPTQIVYHEYVHKIIHTNFRRVPVWLDEGMAEFYGHTEVSGATTTIGAPGNSFAILNSQTLLPLETLLRADAGSPHYTKDDKVTKFYAQATALTHFLIFGPGMGNGKKFNEFLAQLQTGKDQVQVFEAVFGPLKKNEQDLQNYIRKLAVNVIRLNNPAGLKDVELVSRKLDAYERDAELGWFHVRAGDREIAARLLKQSLDAQDNAVAHEALGIIAVDENRDAEAAEQFKHAFTMDPTRYRSAFYYAATDRSLSRDERKKLLADVLRINPLFASALMAQSQLAADEGDLPQATQLAINAIKMEPFRAGYYSYLGAILERRGDKKSAAKVVQQIVELWKGPDQLEAAEILHRVDPSAAVPDPDRDNQSQSVTTEIASVSCSLNEKKRETTFKFKDRDGKEWDLAASGNFMIGIPDTFWWVGHFNVCNGRMNGMPAVVRYRKKDGATELLAVEMRNPLMMPTESAGSAGK